MKDGRIVDAKVSTTVVLLQAGNSLALALVTDVAAANASSIAVEVNNLVIEILLIIAVADSCARSSASCPGTCSFAPNICSGPPPPVRSFEKPAPSEPKRPDLYGHSAPRPPEIAHSEIKAYQHTSTPF